MLQSPAEQALHRALSLPAEVVLRARPLEDFPNEIPLRSEEEDCVRRAVAKRRREFSAGRLLAREAMQLLGHVPSALPTGDKREPLWPKGLIGSISHSNLWCAVVLAKTSSAPFSSIGIDIEVDQPMKEALWAKTCTPRELEVLAELPRETAGQAAKAIFSAKESFYKAQFPLTHTFCGFQTIDIDVDFDNASWSGRVAQSVGPQFQEGLEICGSLTQFEGHIVTSFVVAK